MEQLPAFGKEIADIVMPTIKAYIPLLVANASAIKSTKRESFNYGPDPRHNLDVYYPPSTSSSTSSPVLVFLYGGGLVRGDKIQPAIPDGLVHANLGHFFASKYGYTVVIPDYRLVPNGAKFPSGGEDLELVVKWMNANFVNEESTTRELYMMGNSAGGVHLTTYLFAPQFQESRQTVLGEKGLRLRKVVELAVPFHFWQADPSRKDVLEAYYGEDIDKNCPWGLLNAVCEDGGVTKILPDVRFLITAGQYETENEICCPCSDFIDCWRGQEYPEARELTFVQIHGHNHISPPLSLGTGKENEEKWGHMVASFFSKPNVDIVQRY